MAIFYASSIKRKIQAKTDKDAQNLCAASRMCSVVSTQAVAAGFQMNVVGDRYTKDILAVHLMGAISVGMNTMANRTSRMLGKVTMKAGRSESPEKIERGYMHGFVMDFAGGSALDACQKHPDHKRVGEALIAGATGGLDGILVFDLPVAP